MLQSFVMTGTDDGDSAPPPAAAARAGAVLRDTQELFAAPRQSPGIVRLQQHVYADASGELVVVDHQASMVEPGSQPLSDNDSNPGGAGNDAYSIQAWIWLEWPPGVLIGAEVPTSQAIFVNQPLEHVGGVALYLQYDVELQRYRLASARGNVHAPGSTLFSAATLPFGEWVNIATTYDPASGTLALYINGELDRACSAFPRISASPQPHVLIARALSAASGAITWPLYGYLHSVDVWKVALTREQLLHWSMN